MRIETFEMERMQSTWENVVGEQRLVFARHNPIQVDERTAFLICPPHCHVGPMVRILALVSVEQLAGR